MTKTHAAHGTTTELQADGVPGSGAQWLDWTGATGDGRWADRFNWAGHLAPTASSDVDFATGGEIPYAVTGVGQADEVLVYGDTVTLSGASAFGSVVIDGTLTIAADASFSADSVYLDPAYFPVDSAGTLNIDGKLSDNSASVAADWTNQSSDGLGFGTVSLAGAGANWTTAGAIVFGSFYSVTRLTVTNHGQMSWGQAGLQLASAQMTIDESAQLSGSIVMEGAYLTAVALAGAGVGQIVTVSNAITISVDNYDYYGSGIAGTGARFGSGAGVRLDLIGAIGEDPANPGQVLTIDAGFVMLGHANNTYTGGTYLVAGTLELAAAGAAGSGEITFSDYGTGTLQIDQGAFPSNGISSFTRGDIIQLKGQQVLGHQFVPNFGGDGGALLITMQGVGTRLLFFADGSYGFNAFTFTPDQVDGVTSTEITLGEPPCFLAGTRILTARGEIPVEQIAAGDMVITQSGRAAPVRWVGHSRFDLTSCPAPERFRPIRIRRGAIAPGVPVRDLLVSRGHALLLDGVLIPALYLANGSTIVEDRSFPSVTYWHVELDRHDVLLAEGAAAESYLDTGNRHLFEAGVSLAEDRDGGAACAPIVQGGEALLRVREALGRRIPYAAVTRDPALHLLADGVAFLPACRTGDAYHFVLSQPPEQLRLISRANITDRIGETPDMRVFGIAVGGVTLRAPGVTRTLDLTADPLGAGFSWPERAADGAAFRWTDGDACLPAALWQGVSAFTLAVKVNATVPYWIMPWDKAGTSARTA